jgi:chemotaxis protein histidine kinase CheA
LTPICITGSAPLLPAIFGALQPLGLSPAKPLARDPKVTLHSWHQRVIDAGNPKPSRVWQQLAADLLLDNIDTPQWAWAEESALQLLDFWAGFDDSVRFVLLAETPAQTLLRQRNLANTQQLLSQWATQHQTMLRFALRHPERCLLVWGHQAQQEPQALAQKMAQRWALSLSAKPQPPSEAPDTCAVADHLAQHLCNQLPQVQQLLSDLQACVEPVGMPTTHSYRADPTQLLARYLTLADRSAEAAQVAGLQKDLKAAQEQTQTAQAQAKAAQEQAAAAAAQAKAAQDQTGKTTEQLKAAQAKAAEADKASAAAQAELAKAQAALKAAQDQAKAAQTQTAGAQTASAAQLAGLQKDLKTAQDQGAATAAQVKAAQADLTKTQAALKTAQDQAAKTAAELKAAQDQLTAATAQTAKLQQELQAKTAETTSAQALHKEAQEDADTLLLQLHETQEELESYCIQNDELQQQMKAFAALQQRWQQLFAANPQLFASDNVAFAINPDATVACHISGLHMAGRQFDQLHATLALDADGSLGLSLPRAADGSGPLQRWPGNVPAGGALSLNPTVGANTPPQRIATYMQLSTSDWHLAQSLPRLLLAAVQASPGPLNAAQQTALAQALHQHEQSLAQFKRMLRFDQATLTQLATPEQLHLQLDNASHDGVSTPSLSLQLHTTPTGVHLQLGASTLLGNATPLALHLDTQGWRQPEVAALNDTQRLRINALLAVLPLALLDAVAHGANKDSLAPWGKLAPQLRASSQQSHTPVAAPAPQPIAAKAPKAPKATKPAAKPQKLNETAAPQTTTKAADSSIKPAVKAAKQKQPTAKAPATPTRRKTA